MPQFVSQGGSLQDATLVPGFKSLPSGKAREWHSGCLTVLDSILLNQRIQVKLDPSQIDGVILAQNIMPRAKSRPTWTVSGKHY